MIMEAIPPQFHVNALGMGMGTFAMVAMGWGILVTLFWMVCAWRAMRAHERLAESVEELVRKPR
jgi:hypothetical protein